MIAAGGLSGLEGADLLSATVLKGTGYDPAQKVLGNSGPIKLIDAAPQPGTDPVPKTQTANLTPASAPAGQPNWNALGVGQVVNGGKVLDANVFRTQLLDRGLADPNNQIGYNGQIGSQYYDVHKGAKALGTDLSDSGAITLYGFTPKNFTSQSGSGDNITSIYDEAALKSEAAKFGIDTKKYTTASHMQAGLGNDDAPTLVPEALDGAKLSNAINQAAFTKAASNPNAIFTIDSQRVGADHNGDRNTTFYVQRGDRLVPVQSTDYRRDSDLKDTWTHGIVPLAGIAASAFLGPEVAAYFGGGVAGAAAAGAASGALNSAINGQNILRGAAIGGVTGGIASGAGSAVTSFTGSDNLGRLASGITGSATRGVLTGSQHLGQDVLGGAISSANFGGMAGLTGPASQFLNTAVRYGYNSGRK